MAPAVLMIKLVTLYKQHLWTLAFSEFSNTELNISSSDGITEFLWPIWARNMGSKYGLIVMGAIGKK